jgi:Endodeoxyribonuclease RusA
MSFVLLLTRQPPSGNKPPNRKFQEAVRAAAQAKLGPVPFLEGDLFSRITWFHREKTTQDVDNIAKNIHDALKGVLFGDDVQIVLCLTRKIDATKDYVIEKETLPDQILDELNLMLGGEHLHVLCVEVGSVTSSRVVFGAIDESYPP